MWVLWKDFDYKSNIWNTYLKTVNGWKNHGMYDELGYGLSIRIIIF